MLGQGLESLIPPQKSPSVDTPQSGSNQQPTPTPYPSASFTIPAREEHLLVPASPAVSNPPKVSTLATPQEEKFLPKEEEEKLLEPPAIIHEEPTKPLASTSPPTPAVSPPPVSAPASAPTPTSAPNPPLSPTPQPVSKSATLPPLSPLANTIRPETKKVTMGEAVFLVEVDTIKPNPHQPRRNFDETTLKELAGSIREHGILQPLVVTKIETEVPGGTAVEYQLIAGERRLMASKIAGLERVPVIVRTLDQGKSQSLEMAIIENLQREDLNPIEMARAFARLQDEFRMTQREIATRLGKSRETVANTLRLLDLPFDVQEAIGSGKISESHGRLLLSLKDPANRDRLFRDLVSKSLTTRELRAQVAGGQGTRQREKKVLPELKMLQDRLASFLGAPVTINQTGESGRITINFYSREELENILEHLSKTVSEDEHSV
jgi:ParB family chromosome partitioning protein